MFTQAIEDRLRKAVAAVGGSWLLCREDCEAFTSTPKASEFYAALESAIDHLEYKAWLVAVYGETLRKRDEEIKELKASLTRATQSASLAQGKAPFWKQDAAKEAEDPSTSDCPGCRRSWAAKADEESGRLLKAALARKATLK